MERGFEADEAYYITHAEQVRPKEDADLAIDPPPDLVIEVEITSSSIEKKQLFAAMGIPEFWRHDGDQFWMYRLSGDQYEEIESSVELPGFRRNMVIDLLSQRRELGETTLIRQFRASIG